MDTGASPPSEIARTVRGIFAESLGQQVEAGARLDALGMDSMTMIEVSIRIEETWDIVMPDLDEIHQLDLHTIDQIVDLVEERVAS